jgi:hypothetical protein
MTSAYQLAHDIAAMRDALAKRRTNDDALDARTLILDWEDDVLRRCFAVAARMCAEERAAERAKETK